ncbi:ATP-dependent DNA helicase, partial [Aegicerativicinus sediminis]
MTIPQFFRLLKQKFPFEPTSKQLVVLEQLSKFVLENNTDEIYMLKGFAGTGKTSIIGTLVSNIWEVKKSVVLMAPTGRAAKVISNYSGKEAFTIHKKIYFPKKDRSGGVKFVLQPNKHRNTIFIVDEASMIPDNANESKIFENGSLLEDLVHYVYSGFKCKLILIGDTAQLPPVKSDLSPALDKEQLEWKFNKKVLGLEMDEVVRQEMDSGILINATEVREVLFSDDFSSFKFNLNGFKDIVRLIDGHEILDALNEAYSDEGYEETTIIVRSNKRANLYNQQIRSRILYNENELSAGDQLMVVKNNYFWIKPTTEAGFIANGDIIEVLEIYEFKELYGFKFARVKVKMVDYPR